MEAFTPKNLNKVSELVKTAQNVLRTEAAALQILAEELPADFEHAIDEILRNQGRVIVSGIGKSGHIARKVSATLSSTGTASYYVHPSEASHGDLGMISTSDILIILSNSGETTEMSDILAHARRFSIPIIGVSSKPQSTLMKAADYRLLLPDAPEACPMGMAPTTSTTMMLALGDAMAVSLMEKRNFRPENFHDLHPGGQLGAKMLSVAQLMHEEGELPIVAPETSMQETLLVMTSKGFGIAAIVEDEKLVGVISDGDLRRHMDKLLEKTAGEIASAKPVTIKAGQFAAEALGIMNANKISVLIVTDEKLKPIGILHIHDLLRAGVM